MQVSQTHEVISSPAIVIQTESLLALLDSLLVLAGKQVRVCEIQMRIDALGREVHGLKIEGNSISGIFSFEIAIASGHQARELVLARPVSKEKPKDPCCPAKEQQNQNALFHSACSCMT